jgi:predicted nuclease of predicted toxin-antitoxin system
MRLLANENVPAAAVDALRAAGHDVVWVRIDGPGSTDEAVLAQASREARTVLTFDKDFGELAFRARLPASAGVILVRLRASSPAGLATRLVHALQSRSDWAGQFAVVESDRIRLRLLPRRAP